MCGIAGIIQSEGDPNRSLLRRMAASLSHRGPDASEFMIRDGVGLAHNRLAIVGLGESGRQPCASADGWWALAFNGEIFDHQQLRETLPNAPYRGSGDNETLLQGLACRGIDFISELNGFFAFAAIDHRARRLYLARDRYGVKPMYYAPGSDRFLFGSEQKAIIAAGFESVLDDELFRYHVARLWSSGDETCLAGIFKLQPGCLLEIDLDSLAFTLREWFPLRTLSEPARQSEFGGATRAEGADVLEAALDAAIERRLMSEVPVALLCSGGIDSSLITAMVARKRPEIPAYVLSVPEFPQWDELPYARAVADAVGIDLRPVPVTQEAWRRELVGMIAHFEYPFWIESGIGLGLLAERVHADGFRVLIGGEGADEVFGGYDYKHAEERAAAHAKIAAEPPELTFESATWPADPSLDKLFRIGDPPESHRLFREHQQAEAIAGFAHLGGARAAMTAAFVAELRLFLQPSLTKLDKATMRHSVEMREPFLDAEVVAVGTNMPLEWLHYPKAKGILRDVAARYLPRQILERNKIGFSLDPAPFLLGQVRREFLRDGLLRDVLGIRKDWKLLKFLDDGDHRGRAVSRIVCAEIWLRHFIGGQGIGTIDAELWV